MVIRPEEPDDRDGIRTVNLCAFETHAEANLVEALRQQAQPLVSLVADVDGKVVGHILFSPVTLANYPNARIMGLGPMAVLPDMQRRGVGSILVREGLERCRALGCDAVIVLGHAEYYPRFGFVAASHWDLRSEYDVPDEFFMALELKDGSLAGKSGTVHYHPAFGNL